MRHFERSRQETFRNGFASWAHHSAGKLASHNWEFDTSALKECFRDEIGNMLNHGLLDMIKVAVAEVIDEKYRFVLISCSKLAFDQASGEDRQTG